MAYTKDVKFSLKNQQGNKVDILVEECDYLSREMKYCIEERIRRYFYSIYDVILTDEELKKMFDYIIEFHK